LIVRISGHNKLDFVWHVLQQSEEVRQQRGRLRIYLYDLVEVSARCRVVALADLFPELLGNALRGRSFAFVLDATTYGRYL
jgi:hypothetical protein